MQVTQPAFGAMSFITGPPPVAGPGQVSIIPHVISMGAPPHSIYLRGHVARRRHALVLLGRVNVSRSHGHGRCQPLRAVSGRAHTATTTSSLRSAG